MAKHDLRWIVSYETLKFDTVDGDLHKDQYAFYEGKYYIRNYPENNAQFSVYIPSDPDQSSIDFAQLIAGKTEVHVIEGEHMYYDEFSLPDGRKYREASTKIKYNNLEKKNAGPRLKKVTDAEIVQVKKDDNLWL